MKRRPTQKQVLLLFDNQQTEKKGAIIRKPGSNRLYILFTYFGRRVEKTTGLDDTAENREKVRKWFNHIIAHRDDGKLVFSEAFPRARDEEKSFFAELEGNHYAPPPSDISMGEYIQKWKTEIIPFSGSRINQGDYLAILKAWIIPYFSQKTFYDLTRLEIQKFLGSMKCKIGKNKGKTVSKSRAGNVITVLRALFENACDEYHWEVPDPFRNVKRHMPKKPPKKREIFRFDEWQLIVQTFHPWYRPMIEFMVLTGMIHSEISGLQRGDILPNHVIVQNSIVRKVASDTVKTIYRGRKIPITQRMRMILDEVLARTDSLYVFAERDGGPYLREGFIEDYWSKPFENSGIPYHPPYSMRHSFAAWSLLIGVDPLRLVNLMGHGSKQMVFEVYGNYIEGIEEDYWDILNYFGKDYVEIKKKPLAFYKNISCESLCESHGPESRNILITR